MENLPAVDLKPAQSIPSLNDKDMTLPLSAIRIDGGTQTRADLDQNAIEEYAEQMKAGANFPRVIVFQEGKQYWLADGFHRYLAAERAGLTQIHATVKRGSQRDALLYSASMNDKHGIRRTNADKRFAVSLFLKDPEWRKWSDQEIARRCNVSHTMVSETRKHLSGNSARYETRAVERSGKTFEMNVAPIAQSNAARIYEKYGPEVLLPAPGLEPVRTPLTNESLDDLDVDEKPLPESRALKPERPEKPRVDWSQHAKSATKDETQLIKWMLGLYNGGAAVALDPTYSEGRLWDSLPKPLHRGDIKPVIEGCEKMDARQLPFGGASLSSIFFDPPFVPKDTEREGNLGIIEARFSGYGSMEELWQFYLDAFVEFYRVLEPGGLLLVKNMDQISGGTFYPAFDGVAVQAREVGFSLLYVEVLYREGPLLMSPNMEEQINPRHCHCYYFVLRKSAKPKDRSKVLNAPGWTKEAQNAVANRANGKKK